MLKLHYGGQIFDVADSVKGSDLTASEGTIMVRTDDGGFLTLVTGPGIPIALYAPPRNADGSVKRPVVRVR